MSYKPFHPDATTCISNDSLALWIRAPVTGDLLQVPGLGPAYAAAFKAAGITTTHQLIAKYLSFKGEGVGSVELMDRFYYWIQDTLQENKGNTKAGVAAAIGEKANLVFPKIYDVSCYERR